MTIYTHLMGQALDEIESSRKGQTTGEALAELLRCRARLNSAAPSRTQAGWAPSAVADELAFDVSLMALARPHDLDCDPLRFERPQEERFRLEQGLAARGVRLDELNLDETVTRSVVKSPRSRPGDNCAARSSRRAASVAAWVLRSMPTLAKRLER
jgi:hypothetical protein